jgi:hypothetical protein
MPVTELQIEIYALTKQIMELSEQYILETKPYEKVFLLERINSLYSEIENKSGVP